MIDLRSGTDEVLNSDEAAVLRELTRRWTLEILMLLDAAGEVRFSELLAALPGINQRVLTQRLLDLEEMGIVDRHETREPPGRSGGQGRVQVSYSVNARGEGLRPALRAVREWIRTVALAVEPGHKV